MAVYISPEVMEERILMVIRKYNVLYMEQLLKFLMGKEKAAGKAVSRLFKEQADLQKSLYRPSCI